jgi:hypothetical protein
VAELTDFIDENLDVLAAIRPGRRIEYDPSKPGRLRLDQWGSSLYRSKEDSILNDARYLRPITALVRKAVKVK